jgi:ABC-type multidrug transport system fused ATPase/permease subunit
MLPTCDSPERTTHLPAVILAPWLQSANSRKFWGLAGILTLLSAVTESGLGLWMRQLGSQITPAWLWALIGLLALRLVLWAARDLCGERLVLEAGSNFHHNSWNQAHPASAQTLLLLEQGTRAAMQLRTGLVSLLLILPTMAWIAPRLALCALLAAGMLALTSRWRGQELRELTSAEQKDDDQFHLAESWAVRSLPEALAGGLLPRLARIRHRESLRRLGRRFVRIWRWQLFQSLMEVMAHAISLGLCAAAWLLWKSANLTLGQFLSFLTLAMLVYRPLREAGKALPAWHRARLLDRSVPQAIRPDAGELLQLKAIAFSHPGKPLLFENLDFQPEPSGVFLLHGPNGCGKTTFLRLCSADLPPTSGQVIWPNGRIHWIDQETVLPPLSLRHWTGQKEAPRTPALDHFHAVHVAPFLSDWNWERVIENGGHILSRGQRLRLRLWAMACVPGKLWLLDEPLSALPRPERWELLKALLACRGDAVVLIADQELPDLETVNVEMNRPRTGLQLRRLPGH